MNNGTINLEGVSPENLEQIFVAKMKERNAEVERWKDRHAMMKKVENLIIQDLKETISIIDSWARALVEDPHYRGVSQMELRGLVEVINISQLRIEGFNLNKKD